MMLNAANRTVIRLWKDESGVVFALTVVVFLTLFMMGLGVAAAALPAGMANADPAIGDNPPGPGPAAPAPAGPAQATVRLRQP